MADANLFAVLTEQAQKLGASGTAVIPVDTITFDPVFRDACIQNSCGKFNRCWMCPPDVGEIDALIDHAHTFNDAFIFQTISSLEDSFDIEGMLAAGQKHNDMLQALAEEARRMESGVLILGGGACKVCERCAKLDNEPCRTPELAIASLEAYGVDVTQLAKSSNMKYINGVNTVTYFGAFLF